MEIKTPNTVDGTSGAAGATSTYGRTERRGHEYHAEAHLLSGRLERPIVQEIPKQASVSLRDWRGGHIYQRAHGFDLEGLVSFKSGYTRVSGYRSLKKSHAFVTVSTAVMEGLNVLDVLTCDRVVVQVSTEHEPNEETGDRGHVPRVHFLGTQFVNLKISGYEVKATVNLEACGNRPAGDVPYLYDRGFLASAEAQASKIREFSDIAGELKERADELKEGYEKEQAEIACLEKSLGSQDGDFQDHSVVCSLVSDVSLPIPGVTAVGNVLFIRDFGILSLGNVEVGRQQETDEKGYVLRDERGNPYMGNYFTVRMLDMHLGCVGDGKVVAASGKGNGTGKP